MYLIFINGKITLNTNQSNSYLQTLSDMLIRIVLSKKYTVYIYIYIVDQWDIDNRPKNSNTCN